jgi:hypothetical protein
MRTCFCEERCYPEIDFGQIELGLGLCRVDAAAADLPKSPAGGAVGSRFDQHRGGTPPQIGLNDLNDLLQFWPGSRLDANSHAG